jgi:DNA-directed RNA polymerase subunit RPC12/RpoP
MTLLRECPQCGSNDTYRSHRKAWEYVLFALKPYRCKQCKQRFYSVISSHDLHV